MPEFQAWRLCDLSVESERRITWINGTLGIGKSIMAGYFIDLLKCQYPNAIVAYFFCRSNQPGLTNARDMLRTLAYQCIEKDKAARTVLETLKSKGFQVTDNLGIGYLFEKLLLDPLRNIQEIYIVLDGLDEADMTTQDYTDRTGRPEMHILLSCLAKLPSTRLLCISRPSAKISDVIKNTFSKSIGKGDNAKDIDSYVQKTVNESKTLKAQFNAAFKDPIEYFRDKGSGIFLWVVLVLQQLEKAISRSEFLKYLEGFSTASGSMENLYCAILSRINEENKKWVREIIRWLVVAERQLPVNLLQHLVEWCLEDELVIDFRRFLEVDCGSILQLLPIEGEDDNVRLVHETFRSFVVNQERCPQGFFVDVTETHGYLALKCLQCLTSGGDGAKECSDYAVTYWVNHLCSAQQTKELLLALRQFFSSNGLGAWVKWLCEDFSFKNLNISVETKSLRDISRWLCTCATFDNDPMGKPTGCSDPGVQDLDQWRSAVLTSKLSILGEALGKAAAAIWLHERLDDCSVVMGCFMLGLKYYWKRADRSQSNLEELKELINTRFRGISVWSTLIGLERPVVKRNIGLAYLSVYRWDDCIRYIDIEDNISDEADEFRKHLTLAFLGKRDYDRAIAVIEKYSEGTINLLLRACSARGDYSIAVKVFQEALDRQPTSLDCWESLYDVYEAKRDYDAMIELSESALANDRFEAQHHERLLQYLYSAFRGKGEYGAAVAALQRAIDRYPKNPLSWFFLGSVYTHIGDYDGAIRILQLGLLEILDERLYCGLASVHIAQQNYEEAIEVLKTGFETQVQSNSWIVPIYINEFIETYQKKGDSEGLVRLLQTIVNKHPADYYLWESLGRAHMANGDYDEAIKVFEMTLKGSEVPQDSLHKVLFTAYKKKGDYVEAIKIFETRVNPNLWPSFWGSNLLEVYEAKKNYDGAIKVYEAIVNAPNDAGIWGWPTLLKAYAAKGDFDGAIERFETAVDQGRIEPSLEIAYTILDSYKAKGDYDRAVDRFTKVVNLLPLESWSWHILGETYKAKKEYKRAIEVYQSALQNVSIDYSVYKCFCDLYLLMSNYQRVLECYERGKEFAPESFLWAYLSFRGFAQIKIDDTVRQEFVWYSVGEAYKKMGNKAKACKLYDSAIGYYKSALEKGFNSLFWEYSGLNISYGDFDVFRWKYELPEVVLWTALGEACKAKGDVDKALQLSGKHIQLSQIMFGSRK